ncbi:MAG: hypothetical protein KF708_13800 [Pirellulales bacterium]|nr:hypothetical protein [Pirellulales bacterium]
MQPSRRVARAIGVLGGIMAIQFLLYGSSLLGRTIFLPLDLLPTYLPGISADVDLNSVDPSYADLVLVDEVFRVRAAREVRAGRLPLWDPDNFAGAPFIANNISAVFSPYRLLDYLFPSPVTVAWTHFARALVAGCGAYLFFRQSLRVRFWPAAIGAWCFPLTGYLVQWAVFGSSCVVTWLPWMLLAVQWTVRRPSDVGGLALAVFTAFVLLSGHLADGALVLLASGLFAVWRLAAIFVRQHAWQAVAGRGAALAAGWLLGILLAAPQILPTLEYIDHSYRMAQREAKRDERPALGIVSLPQMVIPYFYGTGRQNEVYLLPGFLQESAAAGYAGMTVAFFLAPLAAAGRRRGEAAFWFIVALVGAAWTLGIPGFALLAHLPLLRLLTFNRFMFVTAFALLALGVMGIDTLARRRFAWRRWMIVPPIASLALTGWCLARAIWPPEAVFVQSGAVVLGLFPAPAWFVQTHLVAATLGLLLAGAWFLLRVRPQTRAALIYVLPMLLVGEMAWNAHGLNAQCDPKLYYPEVPFLADLAQRPPGRICGQDCLPPMLNQMYGLRQIRGYDGVDPRSLVELVLSDEFELPWRKKLEFPPASTLHHMAPLESPIHDLLGVRYLVFRSQTYRGPATVRGQNPEDFTLVEMPNALPRAFVPRRVASIADQNETLTLMRRVDFKPRDIAFVREKTHLAATDARGEAHLVREQSDEIELSLDMQTPGLVVLADWWYPGWRAYLDGDERPILLADYALRGVEVSAGQHQLIFRYEPNSFARGVQLAALSGTLLMLGSLLLLYRQRSGGQRNSCETPAPEEAPGAK